MTTSASQAIKREISELKQLLGYWKTVTGALTWITALLPIGGLFTDQLLPGALRILAPGLGITISIIVVLFLFYANRERASPQIERRANVLFGIALLLLVVFVSSWLTWVVEAEGDRHITGMTFTDEAAQTIAQGKTPEDPKSLLDRFGHNSEDRIWRWRNAVTAILAFSFAGFFAAISGSFFLFTLRLLRPVSNDALKTNANGAG